MPTAACMKNSNEIAEKTVASSPRCVTMSATVCTPNSVSIISVTCTCGL